MREGQEELGAITQESLTLKGTQTCHERNVMHV